MAGSVTVRVITGDCREVMPTLAPGSVDCVVTDPPYGETSLEWDKRVWGWLDLVRPLLKPHGSVWVFGSMRYFMESADFLGDWRFVQDIVWEKHNGTNPQNDRFRRVHEHAIHLVPRDVQWKDVYRAPQFTMDATPKVARRKKRPPQWGDIGEHTYVSEDGGPRLMRSVLQVRSCHGSALHPTQKPDGILAPLISYSCPQGGMVLDPFGGSGSTGAVAASLGRDATIIEINLRYACIAHERVKAA